MNKRLIVLLNLYILVLIKSPFLQAQIQVVGSNGADGIYNSLTNNLGAFEAINKTMQTNQIINIKITDNSLSETGTHSLKQGEWAVITIFPSSAGLMISGKADKALLDLNGADNVIIDGRINKEGNNIGLTIVNGSNSTIAGNSTIRFINSAQKNIIRYCEIKGSTLAAKSAVIFFSNSISFLGNSENIIEYCNITGAGNPPYNCLYSEGIENNDNSGNIIRYNNFIDFFSSGYNSSAILISEYNNNWNISNNNFYRKTSFSASANNFTCINFSYSYSSELRADKHIISDNFIGGSQPGCSGKAFEFIGNTANSFIGINIKIAEEHQVEIFNNTISNLFCISSNFKAFIGINLSSGNADVHSNSIGSATGNDLIQITTTDNSSSYGISINTNPGNIIVNNNKIGAVKTLCPQDKTHSLYGIHINKNNTNVLKITNNIIGSTTSKMSFNASSSTNTGTDQFLVGIYCISGNYNEITGNTIANLYNNCRIVNSVTAGIIVRDWQVTSSNKVSNNKIYDLISNAGNFNNAGSGSPSLCGIKVEAKGENPGQEVSGNVIYSLTNNYNGNNQVFVIGISYTGPAGQSLDAKPNVIARNFIYNLNQNSLNTLSEIRGISNPSLSPGSALYANNIISLGENLTQDCNIYGFWISPGTADHNLNIYFNTVFIHGKEKQAQTNSSSFCLYSYNLNRNKTDIRNNIFYNARKSTGTGKNYAIRLASGDFSKTFILNYNNYLVSDSNGVLGMFGFLDKINFEQWKASTLQDKQSLNLNPQFISAGSINPADYTPSVYLQGDNTLINFNDTILKYDFLNNLRKQPEMGALENQFCSPPDKPTGDTLQYFCNNPVVKDLKASGSFIKWYNSPESKENLPDNTLLINNSFYYASQTVYNCESEQRLKILVNISQAPVFNTTPVNIVLDSGKTYKLSVNPVGTAPFIYQWYKNDIIIPAANDSVYIINDFQFNNIGVYSCEIKNKCGEIVSLIANLDMISFSVEGFVYYDNTKQSPLPFINVYLNSKDAVVLDSSTTDNNGFYKFNKVYKGTYNLTCNTKIQSKGYTPIDALLINRHYLKLINITGELKLLSADPNKDNIINPIDALLVNRRYLKIINKFSRPDWQFSKHKLIITEKNIKQNVIAICTGDVDTSGF